MSAQLWKWDRRIFRNKLKGKAALFDETAL